MLIMSVAGDATVTISHRYTPKEQLRQHTKIADIIIAAAGLYPRFFNLNIFSLIFFFKKSRTQIFVLNVIKQITSCVCGIKKMHGSQVVSWWF